MNTETVGHFIGGRLVADSSRTQDVFNPATGTAFKQGRRVTLTRNEQRFLCVLTHERGTTVAPERLCGVLGAESRDGFSVSALRNLVYRLRAKLGPEAVECSKDSGYRLP